MSASRMVWSARFSIPFIFLLANPIFNTASGFSVKKENPSWASEVDIDKFMKSFMNSTSYEPCFTEEDTRDMYDVMKPMMEMVMLSYHSAQTSGRGEHSLRTKNIALASCMAEMALAGTGCKSVKDKTDAMTNSLRWAFLDTHGRVDEAFISEISKLIFLIASSPGILAAISSAQAVGGNGVAAAANVGNGISYSKGAGTGATATAGYGVGNRNVGVADAGGSYGTGSYNQGGAARNAYPGGYGNNAVATAAAEAIGNRNGGYYPAAGSDSAASARGVAGFLAPYQRYWDGAYGQGVGTSAASGVAENSGYRQPGSGGYRYRQPGSGGYGYRQPGYGDYGYGDNGASAGAAANGIIRGGQGQVTGPEGYEESGDYSLGYGNYDTNAASPAWSKGGGGWNKPTYGGSGYGQSARGGFADASAGASDVESGDNRVGYGNDDTDAAWSEGGGWKPPYGPGGRGYDQSARGGFADASAAASDVESGDNSLGYGNDDTDAAWSEGGGWKPPYGPGGRGYDQSARGGFADALDVESGDNSYGNDDTNAASANPNGGEGNEPTYGYKAAAVDYSYGDRYEDGDYVFGGDDNYQKGDNDKSNNGNATAPIGDKRSDQNNDNGNGTTTNENQRDDAKGGDVDDNIDEYGDTDGEICPDEEDDDEEGDDSYVRDNNYNVGEYAATDDGGAGNVKNQPGYYNNIADSAIIEGGTGPDYGNSAVESVSGTTLLQSYIYSPMKEGFYGVFSQLFTPESQKRVSTVVDTMQSSGFDFYSWWQVMSQQYDLMRSTKPNESIITAVMRFAAEMARAIFTAFASSRYVCLMDMIPTDYVFSYVTNLL